MAKLYIKNTDGTFAPHSSIAVTKLDVVQNKGNSLTSAMSQKAVTDELGTIQDAIASIVNAGYVFAGVATPSTDPGTPEAKVFYIANGKGTYTNFGGLEVTEDEVVILKYDTAWHKVVTGIASQAKLTELEDKVNENDKSINGSVGELQFQVGGDTQLVLTPIDYTGMVFNGNAIVQAGVNNDSFMIRIESGIEYDILPAPISVRSSPTPFSIGGDTGASRTFPFSLEGDGYALITVQKSAGNFTITKNISGLSKKVADLQNDTVLTSISVDGKYLSLQLANPNSRCNRGIALPFKGKTRITVTVVSGTDTDKWRLYRYTGGARGDALTGDLNFGESATVTIPDTDDGVWLFTLATNIPSARTFGVVFDEMYWTIKKQVDNINVAMQDIVGTSWFPENIIKASGRVSKSLYIGHGGKNAVCSLNLVSGVDSGRWKIYGTNADGTAIDTGTIIVDWTDYGKSAMFTVPANGYVWLFTENNAISTPRTYYLDIYGTDSVLARLDKLQPLAGKTIVCFGDSITEFKYNGKGYCDYLAEMTGATVINVGIGGTQLRQRTTPSLTPVNELQCYAGLDIVNMVKSAMTNDFDIAEASAAKLATISSDDNTAIVARLKAVDWSKVDIITVLGGTNDWYNNGGNTGDKDSTDIGTTCGAMNDIIARICSTKPKIKLYWFTPLIRVVDAPDFSASIQYEIGDMCTYSGLYYQFINAHFGAWDANDVEQIQRSAFRIPQYYSDNFKFNGKNLREFSALLFDVAKNNHIPVKDMYNELGWNLSNFGNFFLSTDNTHPYLGFQCMAEKIVKFITAN